MSKLDYMWILWCACLTFTVTDIVVGSLWVAPQGVLWVYVSWKLLKEYFDDGDDDYPDCLGV